MDRIAGRVWRRCAAISALLLAGCCVSALSAQEAGGAGKAALTIQYSFDEETGPAKDSGTAHCDAALVFSPGRAVQDVWLAPGLIGAWRPLTRDGAQIKNIKPGSEHLLTDADIPINIARGLDYEIDYKKGLAKALPGGRLADDQMATAELVYDNPGPQRAPGHKGKALTFDGIDDWADCGELSAMRKMGALHVDLWFLAGGSWNSQGRLLTKGEKLWIGFSDGHLIFAHDGLTNAAGEPAAFTASAEAVTPKAGEWHHLVVNYENGAATISMDDKEIARTPGLKGTLQSADPLRLGGTMDPYFFCGMLDEVTIQFTPAE